MNLSSNDKSLLLVAIDTEVAKIKRAINATFNQSIKEILQGDINQYISLSGRISNEVPKDKV